MTMTGNMIQSVFATFLLLALTLVLFNYCNAMGAAEAARRRHRAKLETENVDENKVNIIDQPDGVPEAQGNVVLQQCLINLQE